MSGIPPVFDPRELAAYSLSEAGHYLRMPIATLRSWIHGRDHPVEAGRKRFQPLIQLQNPQVNSLSFVNLVEAHVLDALRRQHHVALHKIRVALDYVKRNFGSKHPLVEHKFETDGLDLFFRKFNQLISISETGQLAIKDVMKAHLKRIEHDTHGTAIRLYPFTRKRDLDEPKIVVIDPLIAFGRPSITGIGVATNIVAERYKAGESMDALAKDYRCKRTHVEEAIRCELQLAA